MAMLSVGFYELISAELHYGNVERWFYELITAGRHFLALGATQFSILHPLSKMKIPASLTIKSN